VVLFGGALILVKDVFVTLALAEDVGQSLCHF
jgi:hypothetical protein